MSIAQGHLTPVFEAVPTDKARRRVNLPSLRKVLDQVDRRLLLGSFPVDKSFLGACPTRVAEILSTFENGSVVVFALPISDVALWTWYMSDAKRYLFANHILERAAESLAGECQLSGVDFLDLARQQAGVVSLVSLAEHAGIGRRGLNNLLLHPKHGAWLQLHAVATGYSASTTPAARPNPCVSCLHCISSCPADALTTEDFFPDDCLTHVASFWMPRSHARALSQNSYVECNTCISSCPVGIPPFGIGGYEVPR